MVRQVSHPLPAAPAAPQPKAAVNSAHNFCGFAAPAQLRYALSYNFVRVYKSAYMSPAMAEGIESRLWSMEDEAR
jgi:hypothetical protein